MPTRSYVRALAVDPSHLSTLSVHLSQPEVFNVQTSQLLADAAVAVEPAVRVTAEAQRAAAGELGWWGSYIKAVEDGLFGLHDALEAKGVPYPYGLSILCFVLGVKLVTLPLNYNQLSSSAQMKSIKPTQELVNKWYGDNKQLKQAAVGALFENLNLNPLAGCLPSLAQIPVFLGVYYSVTSIAKAKIYEEGFLWVPNLSGPIADRSEGLSWLTENWVNGVPPLGWHDTLCYLVIPCILVVTQTVSLNLLGSFDALNEDKSTQSAAVALRILPFMLGWFALNAPSGLGLYWVYNNIFTTASTIAVKKITEKKEMEVDVSIFGELGPRRDPLPEVDVMASEWVPQKPPEPEEPADTDVAQVAEA